MTEEEFHPWLAELGAYVLGALEPDEADSMRRHLATCPVCQAEYQELNPVVGLLASVPAEAFEAADGVAGAGATSGAVRTAGPDPAMWERLRARAGLAEGLVPGGAGSARTALAAAPVAHARPRRSAVRWPSRPGASAALSGALVAAAAVGIFVGVHTSPGDSTVGAETVSAVNAADGVSGSVQYRPTDWGSSVEVTVKGVPPGDDCVMYAVDGSGDRSVAGSWWSPTSTSQSLTVPGGVSMQASMIKQFVVETSTGQVLLTVPTS
jgi:anti-sigma factor RsiW